MTVARWHNHPNPILRNSGDTIDRHQPAVAELCKRLCAFVNYPVYSTSLIQAALWHDEAERVLGDMPRPAKSAFPELRAEYEKAERQVLSDMGKLIELPKFEAGVLKLCDIAERWHWARKLGVHLEDDKTDCHRRAYALGLDCGAWWEHFRREVETP